MKKEHISFLEDLLYNANQEYIISQLSKIDNSMLLHGFAANYNWNNGFILPKVILENQNCDLGTALLMFYDADGYLLLENEDQFLISPNEEWKAFLQQIYNRIINRGFKKQKISFEPPLTKVQRFKLKKNNPEIPDILISQSPGNVVSVPAL